MIPSKAESYRLYDAGKFGNKFRTWNNFDAIAASGFSGNIVMRYKGGAGGAKYPHVGEHMSLKRASELIPLWKSVGAKEDQIVFNEAAPDNALVLQGEVMLSVEHISLFWSDAKTAMRKAMLKGQQWHGLRALALLETRLFPSSLDDIRTLFDLYPSSVIEFSAYRYAVGSIPGRNAVIWEVRDY